MSGTGTKATLVEAARQSYQGNLIVGLLASDPRRSAGMPGSDTHEPADFIGHGQTWLRSFGDFAAMLIPSAYEFTARAKRRPPLARR
jgi:hypothetical protein